ncbi:Glycosyltransferase involved in cell wall bisynthesis [Rhodospira trueperi]|uniref:Glycosyltransferase involved in cell wall bisynthesis n=1 Tax=Rhodospira trueperi TaxID=69960 RepID=A0A1G6WBY3_9PROT|nr:Glycosyltransferase involved in cell wall bisynthesis [Rhodospira trueperi]
MVGVDVLHRPGDPRDWGLRLPACDRLEAPGGARALTASVLLAAWRQRVTVVAVRDAGGTWRETSPARLLLERLACRVQAEGPGAAARAWRRVLRVPLPVLGRAEGPLVMIAPSLVGNGAERQMVALVAGLVARGWPVRVLVKHLHDRPGAADLLPDLERLGVPVDVWTAPPPRDTPVLARLDRAAGGLPVALAGDLLGVAGWLAVLKPRAVHAWLDTTAVVGGAAAAVLGVPRVVVGLRNLAPDRLGHPLARGLRPGLAVLSRHPAVTVTANAEAVSVDHARWAGIAPPVVVPNGVVVPPGLRSQRDRPPLVLGVFRLVAHKRPVLWLEVAARVRVARPDARVRLVGDGPLMEAARARTSGVEMPGRVADVAPHFAEASVLLHVSAAEGLPNTVLEAQAAGVPVVAAPAGGLAEALAGPAVDPPTVEALAARVLDLLENPEERCRLAERGRARAARFSMAAMVARHERLYEAPPASVPCRHALRARLCPAGMTRSAWTLARLAVLGEGREIARRIGALLGETGVSRAVSLRGVQRRSNPGAADCGNRPGLLRLRLAMKERRRRGDSSLRLACVGEMLERDGAPLSLLELARGLVARGDAPPALAMAFHDGPLRADWEHAGWSLRVIDAGRPLVGRHVDGHAARLAGALRDAGSTVVLVNGLRAFAGVEAAARAGLPCVWVIREPEPEALADLSAALQDRALSAFGRADRVVFVSAATARAWTAWAPPDRSSVIPNAVTPVVGAPRCPDGDTTTLLAAGAVCPRKGPLDLIAALPLLPDDMQARFRVRWAGRDVNGYAGVVRRAVARLPDSLRDRVELLGEQADMAPVWAAADMAVCPSRAEAAPRAVLEARRAGLPLVTTAVGGIPEQVAHWPHTWLVAPGDPPALARALAAAWRADRPRVPGDIAERHETMLDAYAAVLRSVVGAS